MNGLVELHRHLDGSLRRGTVEALARALNIPVPDTLGFFPGMGLHEALNQFHFTVQLLQTTAALTRVADEMCADAITEGIAVLEVRFAPQLHGMPLAQAVDAVLAGLAGRAGLLLCGLYGDPPALVDELVSVASTRSGVVGIDLAGGPTPAQDFSLADYERPFRRAAELGLGRTVHAGEGRPPAEIRTAIEALGAQRIGHGTTLLDDPSVLDLVLERAVTIEACPTSNWHTGVITQVAAHPLARWLELGVKVTVCTDNTLLSAVDLPEELRRAGGIVGVDGAALYTMRCDGHAAAFSDICLDSP
jgi:adenosine deaminase